MGKQAAIDAYRDSLYDAANTEFELRGGSRSFPIVGGFTSGMKLLGNLMWRPIKVGSALVFGYEGQHKEFPAMPAVPEAFKGTQLGAAFEQSWPLNKEAAEARVRSFGKLLKMDITGSWQDASVANFAEAKENNVIFADEGAARAQMGGGASFVDMLASSKGSGRDR